MNLPNGAQEILDLRQIGKRPAHMVLVSLIGPLRGEVNPVVNAGAVRYDWRSLRGLEVMVVANADTPGALARQILHDIEAAEPNYLGFVRRDTGAGVHVLWGCIVNYSDETGKILERFERYKPHSKARNFTQKERAEWKQSMTA